MMNHQNFNRKKELNESFMYCFDTELRMRVQLANPSIYDNNN